MSSSEALVELDGSCLDGRIDGRGGMDGCMMEFRDASGRQGVAVPQNSTQHRGTGASTTTAAATAATLRSQTCTSPAKNKDPLFPGVFFFFFFPEQHNPKVSGQLMFEVWLYKFRKK